MSEKPAEIASVHTRLLKCALAVEDSRAYWAHTDGSKPVMSKEAFEQYWFGARSLAWVEVLLITLRSRFDAIPAALPVLHRWSEMSPDTRRAICHWHLQIFDPLYRAFTGDYLIHRRDGTRAEVTRDLIVIWVGQQGPGRWTMSTKIQFASKLLSAAMSAGLVKSNRDPRPLSYPRIDDDALEYLMYLLREVEFAGTLLDNPYARSVGLSGGFLEERLPTLPGTRFRRQGDLVEPGSLAARQKGRLGVTGALESAWAWCKA